MANVIYVTEDCNFDCDYCYEGNRKKRVFITKEEIDRFMKEICEQDGDRQSVFVIFGGEALMRPDLVKYIIYNAKKYKDNVHLCLNTNGLWFYSKKNCKKMKKWIQEANVGVSIEVSYDVSGQVRRKIKGGRPSEKYVVQAIDNISNEGFTFHIRYTVNNTTYNNFPKDVVYLLERFPKVKKIVLNIHYHEVYDTYGPENVEQYVKKYALAIYKYYKKPLCDFTCSICGTCDFGDGRSKYCVPGKKEIIVVKRGEQYDFDHF